MAWTYAQSLTAFRALPSADQAFWHNFAHRYTGFTDLDFNSAYFYPQQRTPVQLFHWSQVFIEWFGLPGLGHDPYWVDHGDPQEPMPSVQDATAMEFPVLDQFVFVPLWAVEYPRPKYRVRKSYWTGTPRRRRNL